MYLEGLPEAPSDSDLESDLKDLPQDEDEGDGEGDGNQDTKDPRSATLSEQLARLTKTGGYGGRSVVNFSEKNARRRVMRKGGLRDQVADFFTAVLKETNAVRGLGKFPLKLENVMEKMDEGQDLLARIESADRDRVMAEGARRLVVEAGRANRGPMLGILAAPNVQGQVSIGDLSSITGFSKSHVASCRRTEVTIGPKPASTFRDRQMPAGVTRKKVPGIEMVIC